MFHGFILSFFNTERLDDWVLIVSFLDSDAYDVLDGKRSFRFLRERPRSEILSCSIQLGQATDDYTW